MLTIDDIKNVGFRRAKFGGYKPEDVDAFIDDVQISFEKMTREIRQLNETVRSLNAQVRKFKEEGKAIESVISGAQKVAEKSLDDAKTHADSVISEAKKQSEDIISDAKKEVEINKEISERLKAESAKLRQKLDDIYKRHLQIIDEIPADVLTKSQNEDSNDTKAQEKKEEARVDISKPVTSTVRKRFFEIDAKIGKKTVGGMDSINRSNKGLFGENTSSSKDEERIADRKSKFKDLQFGKEFDIGGNDIEDFSTGAYSGIFRK